MYLAPGTSGSITTERLTLRHEITTKRMAIALAVSASPFSNRFGSFPIRRRGLRFIVTSQVWSRWLTLPSLAPGLRSGRNPSFAQFFLDPGLCGIKQSDGERGIVNAEAAVVQDQVKIEPRFLDVGG